MPGRDCMVGPAWSTPAAGRSSRSGEPELRAAVLHTGQPDLMSAWARSGWGSDDYEMWVRQRDLLPPGSPLWALAQGQIARLDRELGR